MLSSESTFQSLVTQVPHYCRRSLGVARDRTCRAQDKKIPHAGDDNCVRDRQEMRSHVATRLLRSPGRCEPASPALGEVVNVERGSHSPRSCAVHRMPPEILSMIFEECLDEQPPSRASPSEPPLLLGRVCTYWRSVSQKTPRLWTSLSLRFLETQVDRSRDGIRVATAAETWVRRSYPIPLSISFTDNRIFQKDTEYVVSWLLSYIRTHASRWKAIHLKFSSDYFTQLDALSSCTFASMTSFSVHIDHMGWRRGLLSLRLDLSRASRLTSLAYTGPDHVMREDLLVDWTRLTSIALSYDLHEAGGQSATLPRYFSRLALCRNLTELSIGLSISLAQHLQMNGNGAATPMVIELPRLHTLRVRRLSRSVHACALVDAFVLPQLSTLEIDSAVLVGWEDSSLALSSQHPDLHHYSHAQTQLQAPSWHAHHFSALLDRSACHLRALRIRDVDVSPAEFVRMLASPSVSTTLAAFTFEPYPRAYPISDVLAHLISTPGFSGSVGVGHALDYGDTLAPSSPTPSPSLSPDLSLGSHSSLGSIPSSSSSSSSSSSRTASASSSPVPGLGSLPQVQGPSPTSTSSSTSPLASLSLPSLTQLRLGCAHESHLSPLADIFESRTGERAVRAGVHSLAAFELVFHDFVYSHGYGHGYVRGQHTLAQLGSQSPPYPPTPTRRKLCFEAFRERVLRCARKVGGVDVEIRVERPYEPVYIDVPRGPLPPC